MPYPGVPKNKTKEMESCVSSVMSSKEMKSKYPDAKERKSHAIAICHSQIMGKNSKVKNLNKKGGVLEMSDEVKKLDMEEIKQEDEVVEEAPAEEVVEEAPVEEAAAEEAVEDAPVAEEADEEVVEKADEEVAEEEVAEEVADEEALEEPAEEPVAEEAVADEPVEEAVEEDVVEKRLDKIESAVTTLAESVNKLVDSLKKQEDPAEGVPAEGETPKEDAPVEEPAVEEVVEEAVVEEEPKEEVNEVDTSSGGASEEADAEMAKAIRELKERLEKVEQSPAPSKVVLYPQVFGEKAEKVDKSLEEVTTRLDALKKMQNENPVVYMKEGFVDEAFELLKQKKALEAKAK